MRFINQRSYMISGILIPLIIAFTLFRDGINLLDIILVVGSIAAFVFVGLFLRPTSSQPTTIEAIKEALASGKPTLIEYQSEY